MSRNGWEHYDLEKEMSRSNMAQILDIFRRESEKYTNKCTEYAKSLGKLTEEGRKELEEEALLLNEGRKKVALVIAEMLTDVRLKN